MCKNDELERKGLIEALGLNEKDLFAAKQNLLGFYNTLYKINERLEQERKEGVEYV